MSTATWLQALQRDDELRSAGFELLAKKDAAKQTKAVREHYAGGYHLGVLWLPSIWEECQQRVARCAVVARGPARIDDLGITREPIFVQLDPADETLWLAWNDAVPPSLWIPCGNTPASVLAALREFLPVRRPRLHEFECHTRMFMGYRGQVVVPNPYSGELVAADSHELSRHFNFSPVVGGRYWGSSESDDPWPDPEDGPMSTIAGVVLQRRVTRQAEEGVCSYTRRTRYSGSYLGIELHRSRLWVWNIRHPRSQHPEVIEALNARHGSEFPTELPFDVVVAMLGFGHMSEAALRDGLASNPGNEPAYLVALAALLWVDGRAASELLRGYLRDPNPQIRASVIELAARYGWLSLLEEMLLSETDPEFIAYIHDALPTGFPERFDEMGDPLDLYDGDDDDDDEDDE